MANEPSDAVAKRVRAVRKRRDLTVAQLAGLCRDAGYPALTEQAIYNIENRRAGKRSARVASVDELLALARVLQVPPVHLLVPPTADEEPYNVTPTVIVPARQARQWIRGYELLPGDDRQVYLSEVPPTDFEEMGGMLFPRLPRPTGEEG